MNPRELDEILRAARVPAPNPAWAETLAADVLRTARHVGRTALPAPRPGRRWWPAWAAAAALGVAFGLGFLRGRHEGFSVGELAGARRYAAELRTLFPEAQVSAVLDGAPPALALTAVPAGGPPPAVLLRVCPPGFGQPCRLFLTYSGGLIAVGDMTLEVLVGAGDAIVVTAQDAAWRLEERPVATPLGRLTARTLEAAL
jgi:hypothetical protein